MSSTQAESTPGHDWVRAHQFQIGAYNDVPADMEEYKSFGFTAYLGGIRLSHMSEERVERVMTPAVEAGLDVHWFTWYRPGEKEQFIEAEQFLRERVAPIGYSIGDENRIEQLEELGPVLEHARQAAPDALIYHALRGKDFPEFADDPEVYVNYMDTVAEQLRPDMMMFNMYPFYRGTIADFFYDNLERVRDQALASNVPYWNWLQAFAWTEGPFHSPSESEIRLQAFVSLAYGYSGLFYWKYIASYEPYAHGMLDYEEKPTPSAEYIRDIVPELKHIGEVVKDLTSTSVHFVPGRRYRDGEWHNVLPIGVTAFKRGQHPFVLDVQSSNRRGAVLGTFRDDDGNAYFMIVNGNHGADLSAAETAAAVSLRFRPRVDGVERLNRQTGEYEAVPLDNHTLSHYVLPGGTGDLFRIVQKP
ncbi:hypothetical protein ACERK3_00120 [Phycisphaerales bacterium AB-hyl4]|uniref:Uncharacterized protein n=1 Tax=Natronomicrosphaera hydrolytica TaxID=3242702 RepID=A0ABV4TZB8_9BACT